MTAYVVITTVAFLLEAGSQASKWCDKRHGMHGLDALLCFAMGLFGIYALIVGR